MSAPGGRRAPSRRPARAPRGTYLYGILESAGPPRLAPPPRGLAGTGAVRFLPAGGPLWLVVADAPLARYGEAPIAGRLRDLAWVSACALAHERVVERVARAGSVVPMKLFTIFESDERALAEIARTRRTVERVMARIAGRQEWAVRLTLDPGRGAPVAPPAARAAGARAGTLFLLRKRGERDARRELTVRSGATADAIYQRLARRADDGRRRTPMQAPGGPRLLLDAAFLVRAAQARAFGGAVEAEARKLSAGYRLALTGPWPPYNFAT